MTFSATKIFIYQQKMHNESIIEQGHVGMSWTSNAQLERDSKNARL